MLESLLGTVAVPADLASVESVRPGAEMDPRQLDLPADAADRIWQAARAVYGTGIHPAIQLSVRRSGQVLVDRAIGHAAGNEPGADPDAPKVLVTPDTPFNLFSASKAVTAMVIHLLDQRHLLRVADPVCEYIPEFARHNKQWITIRHLLAHRAGIPNLPPQGMRVENLRDPKAIVEIMCDLKPSHRAGRNLAYHAITGGFILGEIVERVTGMSLRAFMTREFRKPFGFRWMNYGVGKRDVGRIARNVQTGPAPFPPFSTLLQGAIGVPFGEVVDVSNDPGFLTSVVPSGNLIATADEIARFYQMLLDGGEWKGLQIYDPRTVRRARMEEAYMEIDRVLGLPLRYSMGFMLGHDWFSVYGPDTRHAFGHVGFTNIVTWADPSRDLVVAFLTNGKPLVYPQLYYLWSLFREIGSVCGKTGR